MSFTQMWDAGKFQEDVGALISKFNILFLSDIAPLISNPNGDRKVSLRAIIALNTPQIQTNLHNVLNEIEKELRDNAHFLPIQTGFSEIESQTYLSSHFSSGFIKSNIINELNSTVRLLKEGANKRGNSSRLTQSFHFFMFEPIFSPVNALNQPI